MAAAFSCKLLVIVFLVASLLNPTICVGVQLEQTSKHIGLFVFGDSLYDNGNNNYIDTTTEFQANFRPYGETFFNYPTGRFSIGRLIPDFIAEYAKLPIIPAYLQPGNNEFLNGANFASGGAGALDETYQGMGIYEEGARKFGFLTLPPLGCWPSIREVNGDCLENVTAIVQLHYKAIFKSIKQLEQQLEGFIYSKLNHYNFFSERMNNPSKYGLEEGMTACCGSSPYRGVYSCGGKRGVKEYELCNNPNENLFFDSNHPTETIYEQLAMLMWSGKSSFVSPNNLKSLFEDAQLQII